MYILDLLPNSLTLLKHIYTGPVPGHLRTVHCRIQPSTQYSVLYSILDSISTTIPDMFTICKIAVDVLVVDNHLKSF